MPTSNKSFDAFDCSQQPLAFVSVNRVLDVLLMRHKFQVLKSVVSAVKVLVVNFKPSGNGSVERFPHEPVNGSPRVLRVFAQRYSQVPLQQSCSARPMPSVSTPRLAQLNGMSCGNADTEKRGNFFQRSTSGKHLFGLRYFGRVYGLATRNPPHVAVIAHLVQTFKTKNWFPRFHAQSPFNMNGSVA
jgi:hypothetical protein